MNRKRDSKESVFNSKSSINLDDIEEDVELKRNALLVKSYEVLKSEMKRPLQKQSLPDPYLVASKKKVRTKGRFDVQNVVTSNSQFFI